MSETEKTKKIELNEVMLAMDVVDTLRHQKSLVERELKAEDHDQALIAKIRKIYAGQGLEVSDETIARGVEALREERFTYTPPKDSFKLTLARLYVNRGRWAKKGALLLVAIFSAYLLYYFFTISPQKRARKKLAQEINLRINQQQDQISLAKERMAHLTRTLAQNQQKTPSKTTAGYKGIVGEAAREIDTARQKVQALEKLALDPGIEADKASEINVFKSRLDKRKALINDLKANLDSAEAAIAALDGLKVLPDKLAGQLDSALAVARENAARDKTQRLYNDAVAALGQGDIKAAQNGYASLQRLYTQLIEEYQLRIVSRPGMPSGVWRIPKGRPNVRNYYILVEAVTGDGRTLTIPVTSEEDGQTRAVKQWGLRVNSAEFERIKRDKQDDGIISRNILGVKKRGYLQPKYLIPTTGGAITQW